MDSTANSRAQRVSKMIRDNNVPAADSFKDHWTLCDEAKKRKLWIYDPEDNRWYSPEDYSDVIVGYNHLPADHYKRVLMLHPSAGIEAGYEKIRLLQNRLELFSKQVVDYYMNHK